jgi:hypothetical protein
MNAIRPLKPNEPGVAYGVISGFPVHDSYPVEDREKLNKISGKIISPGKR